MISKKVYIATDGFVAFIDRSQPKHLQAAAFFRFFAQENYQLYTTIVSINEAYTTVYRTISPSLSKDFLRAMYFSTVNIIYPEEHDLRAAIKTIASTNSTELTFTKALTAVICNKRSIPQIYTFGYFPALFGLQVFYLPV